MQTVNEILCKLKDLDFSSYPYYETQELIRSLGNSGFIIFTLHPGKSITRARSGENFTRLSDLSYLPQSKNTKCQRASTPNKTMFYGTIIEEEQNGEENRMIAISECSSLLRGGKGTTGIEKITYGKWRIIKDVNLVVIINENIFTDIPNNPLLTELKAAFDRYVQSTPENNVREISNFFAFEFSKDNIQNDYDYFISAMFSEIITNDLAYDGVMYPSVQAGGQLGFNVAIKPDIVDKNLVLDLVMESTLYKKGDKSLNVIDKISKLSTWTYYDHSQLSTAQIMEVLKINSFNELTN